MKGRHRIAGWNSLSYKLIGMKKIFAFLILLIFTKYLPVSGQSGKDAYEILVYNSSKIKLYGNSVFLCTFGFFFLPETAKVSN
jgi:hypothetical protein